MENWHNVVYMVSKAKYIMENLKMECLKNLDESRDVWQKFGPAEVITDDWSFRYCFYKYFNYPLHFYVGFDRGEIVGLLPLQI